MEHAPYQFICILSSSGRHLEKYFQNDQRDGISPWSRMADDDRWWALWVNHQYCNWDAASEGSHHVHVIMTCTIILFSLKRSARVWLCEWVAHSFQEVMLDTKCYHRYLLCGLSFHARPQSLPCHARHHVLYCWKSFKMDFLFSNQEGNCIGFS